MSKIGEVLQRKGRKLAGVGSLVLATAVTGCSVGNSEASNEASNSNSIDTPASIGAANGVSPNFFKGVPEPTRLGKVCINGVSYELQVTLSVYRSVGKPCQVDDQANLAKDVWLDAPDEACIQGEMYALLEKTFTPIPNTACNVNTSQNIVVQNTK